MLVDDRVETPLKAVHIFTILHQVDRPLSVSSQLLDSACQPLDGLLDRLRFRLRLRAIVYHFDWNGAVPACQRLAISDDMHRGFGFKLIPPHIEVEHG